MPNTPSSSYSPKDSASPSIGDNIRAWRLARDLQQGELASKLGMSAAQLCRLEKGPNTPSLRTLERIAQALEIPLQDLLQKSPPAPDPSLNSTPDETPISKLPEEQGTFVHARGYAFRKAPRPQSDPTPLRPHAHYTRSFKRPSDLESSLSDEKSSLPLLEEEADLQCCYSAAPPPLSWQDHFPSLSEVRTDSMAHLRQPDLDLLVQKISEYRDLETRTHVPLTPSIPLLYPTEITTDDPEGLAKAMRTAGGIAHAVLFDTVAFFEAKGIRVIPINLPESTESFSLWDSHDLNPTIVLRKQSSEERQQFLMVSEIAWIARFLATGYHRLDDTPLARRFVRHFAAAFLMPEPALRDIAYHLALTPKTWTLPIALQVKQRFGVSLEALLYRLEAIGLLQASLRISLLAQKNAQFGPTEPFPAQRSLVRHSRFSDLKLLANS